MPHYLEPVVLSASLAGLFGFATWMTYRRNAGLFRKLLTVYFGLSMVGAVLMIGISLWRLNEPAPVNAGKMWVALAHATVTVTGNETESLFDELTRFAQERHGELSGLPKADQQSNITINIRFSPETYFEITNWQSRRFSLLVYSHEPPSAWTDNWQMLVDRLAARLGKEHVDVRPLETRN